MTVSVCTQPGCGGIIEDGYCNVCGLPAAVTRTDPSRCAQPGCTGTIEDGYCNVCGSPAPASGAHTTGTSPPSSRTTGGSSMLATAAIGSARAGATRPTRRISATRQTSRLGAGLTSVPSTPVADPRSVILTDPQIPEDKRFCSSCGAPVGRGRDGSPGRTEGFCAKCRTAFSFAPKLKAGDLVGGQYEVAGAIAHGGLGWIYLAQDRNVSDRWVVLKGLLNTGDADAYAAAVSERQFLAQVQHPLIVGIYNFAQFEGAGYIVMEYVGGSSLKQILKSRLSANKGRYDPFPPDQAIAYLIEILPAFSYLHSQGLLYCDFKPDNMIQTGDAVKLIDLGGVRRVDDDQSAIYGTVGFQAPEVATLGPTVPSDIYTIGRTLAVLVMEFRGYQTTYVDHLPAVGETPLFQQHGSLYRVLLKATATNPNDRFQSADELRDQLLAVLREIVADRPDAPAARQSTPSVVFGPPAASGATLEWSELPPLRVDPSDPATAWLASVSIEDPHQRLAALDSAPFDTVEVTLARCRAAIEVGRFDLVTAAIDGMLTADPWEWRAVWTAGLAALARGDGPAATQAFNTVLGQVPGELAPKLALGLACELTAQSAVSQELYRTCAKVDANYVAPAAFGLARTALSGHDVAGALAALDLIGPTSGAYVTARQTRAEVLAGSGLGLPALAQALGSIERVPIDPRERERLSVSVFTSALDAVRNGQPDPETKIAGVPATERALRGAAESAYRRLAALTPERDERIRLVDAANAVRPRTFV